MSYPLEPDMDLDDIPTRELGEHDAMYAVLLDCLESWADTRIINHSTGHMIGHFLEELAAAGYRVTPIPECPFPLLPEPTE